MNGDAHLGIHRKPTAAVPAKHVPGNVGIEHIDECARILVARGAVDHARDQRVGAQGATSASRSRRRALTFAHIPRPFNSIPHHSRGHQMIERAFTKGANVNGAEILFQQVPAGTGGELSQGTVGVTFNWTEMRMFKSSVPHTGDGIFLPYCPNGINYAIPNGNDVISAKFTGCWMAKYTIGGGARVAHVATPECNAAWDALKRQTGFQMLAAFKPADHIDYGKIKKAADKLGDSGGEIIGIITADNKCYAIGAVKHMKSGSISTTIVSIKKVS